MRHLLSLCALLSWIALGGSASCQFGSGGSSGSAGTTPGGGGFVHATNGAAVAGVAAYVVLGFGSCLGDWEACFPDQEKLAAARARNEEAMVLFAAALPAYRRGEASGIAGLCKAAGLGFPPAQYLYGTYLLSLKDGRRDEALLWLQAAADQGHGDAGLLLRREGAGPVKSSSKTVTPQPCPESENLSS